jgi:hypothetical protein
VRQKRLAPTLRIHTVPTVTLRSDSRGKFAPRPPSNGGSSESQIPVDGVQAYKLWRETDGMLSQYVKRAREGKDLYAALDFARYVLWSGVIDLVNQNAHLSPVKIDAAHLQWKAKDLQSTVQDVFSKNKCHPEVELAELEKINHKLDLIAGVIAKGVTPPVAR